ncbi:MAG TPA: hypothetical protein VHH90_03800 [Polyangia bacterium]|nr:hypothetical protein [Polyangia bacterium]
MSGESRGGVGGAGAVGAPRRLVDGDGVEGPWAMDLLRAAEPYQAPPGRKQRVRLSLGHAPRRAPAFLRPLVAALVLMSLGAIATAALGPALPRWVSRAVERVIDDFVRPAGSHASSEARGTPRPARLASASEVALEGPAAPAVAAVQLPPPAATRVRSESAVTHVRRTARPDTREEETALLLEAMRALRRQRDPGRARALLGRYLQQHPNGALAEEALAMSIEAAVAAHDVDAPALARRYLHSYPSGPFRSVAQQALAPAP